MDWSMVIIYHTLCMCMFIPSLHQCIIIAFIYSES